MPQNISIIQVFVASPGDVQEERNALQSIVNEVNQNIGSSLGIRLELVRWETNVTPGFGSDPQDVINKQIGDSYDIFIGILWARAGTPTSRAESGTLEEFEIAYQKHQENPDSVDLLIYFKETPISISDIDVDQIGKIKKFRSSLGEKGGLYWTFDSLQDFEATLRGHLSSLTRKWKVKIDKPTTENKPSTLESVVENIQVNEAESLPIEFSEVIEQIDNEDDYGFFDYIDIYNSEFSEMNDAIEGISKATATIGEKVKKHSNSINLAKEIKDQAKVYLRVKKILKLTSDDLNNYSNSLNKHIKILSDSRNIAFDALSKSLTLYAESYPDEIEQMETLEIQLNGLLEAKESPYISMIEFRDSIGALPKFTSQFNKSKRAATISLDKFIVELDDIENTTVNLLDSITKLKDKNESEI